MEAPVTREVAEHCTDFVTSTIEIAHAAVMGSVNGGLTVTCAVADSRVDPFDTVAFTVKTVEDRMAAGEL